MPAKALNALLPLDEFADIRARLAETPDDLRTYLRLAGLSENQIAPRVEAARRDGASPMNEVEKLRRMVEKIVAPRPNAKGFFTASMADEVVK